MPSLVFTADDAGKVISISGQVNWQVFATDTIDYLDISSGTNATINGGGGVDVIRFVGAGSADYEISLSGSQAVFKHKSNDSIVYIPMSKLGDTVAFGNESPQLLKIESGVFKFGSQVISSTLAPIVGASSLANYLLDSNVSTSYSVSETLAAGTLNTIVLVGVAGASTVCDVASF